MNAVRIWGPGKANPDTFYDELDRRGILAWQDFPTGTWQMPDNEQYKALYKKEAEWMVQRLKHHPSIILWCGGNEHIYMCELDGKKDAGDLKCFMRDTVRYVTVWILTDIIIFRAHMKVNMQTIHPLGIVMAAGHTVHIHQARIMESFFQKIFGFFLLNIKVLSDL